MTGAEVAAITLRTLRVTGSAMAVALAVGVPLGVAVAMRRRRGRGLVAGLVNAGMGLPPTVAGLFVFWLVSRSGPLGLGWGCTVPAMVGAQALIAAPIVAGLVTAALLTLRPEVHLQARALGARGPRLGLLLLSEARAGVLGAAIAAYGGIVSEVGAALVTGCNLHGSGVDTRVLTTAMVEQVRRGALGDAGILAAVLLALVALVAGVLTWVQRRGALGTVALGGRS